MNIRIHQAKHSDYKRVMELYADFVNQPDRYKNHNNDSYKKAPKQPNHFMLVAKAGENIIGFITFSIRTVVRYPKPIVEVEEFYVAPNFRREGIGTRLMNKALDFSRQKDCQYIFLASSKDRVPAHEF